MFFEFDGKLLAQLDQKKNIILRHEFQEIIWLKQGTAKCYLDGERTTISSKSLIIIPKGRVHRFIASHDSKGFVIRFNDEFLPKSSYMLFSQLGWKSNILLPTEESSILTTYFTLIEHESRQTRAINKTTLVYLLQTLIAKIEDLWPYPVVRIPKVHSQSQELWNRFNILIEREFKNQHSVSYFTKELGISRQKLNSVLKHMTGMTAANIIDNRLILQAKRLIIFSNLTIKEIAFDLGFDEHSYFTKVFKKITGYTPSEYKKII